eukprot:COSAG03_NODE_148_length_11571_cov_9.471583_4_plen_285_part_00
MHRRAAASAAGSRSALPAVADKGGDAAVLDILATCEVPASLFVNPSLGFKVIWALKHHAARARQRVRAAKKKQKRPKTKQLDGVALLRSRLEFLRLRMRVIEGDGHCQFRACSDQLYGSQEYHDRVRATAVEYMREHADAFSCFCVEESAFEIYLNQMQNGRRGKPVWGDELTLRAICNALGCTIHVLTSQRGGSRTSWYLKFMRCCALHSAFHVCMCVYGLPGSDCKPAGSAHRAARQCPRPAVCNWAVALRLSTRICDGTLPSVHARHCTKCTGAEPEGFPL